MLTRQGPFVLALAFLLIIGSLLPPGGAAGIAGFVALALTWLAWKRRVGGAVSLGVLFLTCFALLLAGLGPQQIVFALAFVVCGVVVSRVPWLRDAVRWLTAGRIDIRVLAAGVAFAVVSGVALLIWYVIARPDLSALPYPRPHGRGDLHHRPVARTHLTRARESSANHFGARGV